MVKRNVVIGEETWVHYFESVRKASNKIWATKNRKRPVIAKRTLSAKQVLSANFFFGEGFAIQVPVKKGKSVTDKYYKDVVLKKWKNTIRNGAQSRVSNMSDFYMIISQPIRLPLLQCFWKKGR